MSSSEAVSPDAERGRPEGEVAGPRAADADALARELLRLMRLFERARTDCATQCGDGVERAAHVLLAHLVADGPRRLSALAELVHSDPSTVSRQVAHLVQQGLVERRPDPQDGRAARLSATDAGRRLFAQYRRIRNRHTVALLAGWSVQDVHRLIRLLARLSSDIEDYRAHLAATGAHPEQKGPR